MEEKMRKLIPVVLLALSVFIGCAKNEETPVATSANSLERVAYTDGIYKFDLTNSYLKVYKSGALLFQVSLPGSNYILGMDSDKTKVVVLGPHKMYIVKISSQIEANFDFGYEEIPNLKSSLGIKGGVIGNMIASYLSGKALLYGMWGMAPLAAWYQTWAWFFYALPF